jgi:hypothetical protein
MSWSESIAFDHVSGWLAISSDVRDIAGELYGWNARPATDFCTVARETGYLDADPRIV